ncbi:MAG: general secretion pathway protein GspB, partial [Woeseia sp.]
PVRSAAPPAADSQRPSASRASQQQPRPSALAANSANLPTLLDLQANGTLQLPELHLDIHVFSQAPQDRFVFINMSKYREAARLADGPLVKEIVPDGVVLEYEGNTFLLPRD